MKAFTILENWTATCTGSQEYATVPWILNNTQFDHFKPDIESTTIRQVSFITINNIPQDYNNTVTKFEGSYTNGQLLSNAQVTVLQGKSMHGYKMALFFCFSS